MSTNPIPSQRLGIKDKTNNSIKNPLLSQNTTLNNPIPSQRLGIKDKTNIIIELIMFLSFSFLLIILLIVVI